MKNIDLYKVLNKLAKAEISPTTLNGVEILPEHNAMCRKTHLEISDAGGTPRAAFSVLIRKIQGLRSFLLDFCNPKTPVHFGGEGGLDDRVGDLFCILVWLKMRGFFPNSVIGRAFSLLASLVEGIGSNPTLSPEELKAFCAKIKTLLEQMPVTSDEWVKIFSPKITLNPIPIACPPRIPIDTTIGWWDEFILWATRGVEEEDLEAAGTLMVCVGVAAGVVALTGGTGLPLVCSSGGSLAAATTALAVVVGTDRAQAVENELVRTAETCGEEEGGDDTDIGVEEPAKGEGCCRDEESGEILKKVTQMGCEGMEGAVWDLGCMVVE